MTFQARSDMVRSHNVPFTIILSLRIFDVMPKNLYPLLTGCSFPKIVSGVSVRNIGYPEGSAFRTGLVVSPETRSFECTPTRKEH